MNKLTIFSRAIFAIAIMLMVGFPSLAHDFEVDGIYYKYLDETAKTVKVTFRGSYYYSYSNEYTGSVTIPSSVTYSGTTYSVTSIGDRAFYECSGLTSVTIPNSVTSIGHSAFEDCTGLTSVTISNSVTTIGYSTFAGCTSLTSVTIPNSVTSIGSFAFYYCSDLTSITIPNSVTTIGNEAFYECTGLTSVTIGNSVTTIGKYAFEYCSGLTKVILEDGAESISGLSFPNSIKTLYLGRNTSDKFWNRNLKEITIGNSVTSIVDWAFSYCSGLTSLTIGNSVTSIGKDAFVYCDGLTEVNISDLSAWCKIDFSNSGANPLSYKAYLKLNGAEINDLVIPNDITKIKNYAFYGCRGLTSVTIPNSVTTIGDNVFRDCWYMEAIVSLNPTPPTCASSYSFFSSNYSEATLYVPKDSYAKYCFDSVWKLFNRIKKIEILASSITLNNSTIELDKGNAATITATIAPSNATIKNIVWTSSNPQIATVDQLGKVTALSAGTATITAMANDGSNVSASCVVTVGVGGVEGVEMDNNAIEVARYDIHGRLLSEPTPGINIVKMSNGTTRKEIVKN